MESLENMQKFMLNNTYKFCNKKHKIYKRLSEEDSYKIFLEFISSTVFGLDEVYNYLVSRDNILMCKKLPFSGIAFKNKTTGEMMISLKEDKGISKYATLIHELGHIKLFMQNRDICDDYAEVYPIFLELVFLNYVKRINEKEAKALETRMANNVYELSRNSCDLYYELNSDSSKLFYIATYKRLKGYLFAIKFFDEYLENPNKALNDIERFIENESYADEVGITYIKELGQ